jgi:hypothetical protein
MRNTVLPLADEPEDPLAQRVQPYRDSKRPKAIAVHREQWPCGVGCTRTPGRARSRTEGGLRVARALKPEQLDKLRSLILQAYERVH